MNTNTNTTVTITTPAQSTTQSASKTLNWMTELAEILFVLVAAFQFLLVMNDAVDKDFIDFVYYNALPVIGILGYCGLKKDRLTAKATSQDSCMDASK